MEFCRRCLLPETYPNIKIDSKGICNVCLNHDQKFGSYSQGKAEVAFETATRKLKDTAFVVTCSGGADSSYALYLSTQKYKLDVIGANFDNGFQTKTAKENLLEMSRCFNVPIVTVRPDFDVLYELYRDFILKTGEMCTPCCQGCCRSGFIVADNNNIRAIIHGGVSGSRIAFNVLGMFKHHYARFLEIVNGKYNDGKLRDIVTPTDEIGKYNLLFLPQHEDWDEKKIISILTAYAGWKPTPDGRIRHVDCTVVEAVEHLLQKKYGFSRKWMNISANIRAGYLGTEDGRCLIKDQEGKLREEPTDAFTVLLDKTQLKRKQIMNLPFFTSDPAVNYL